MDKSGKKISLIDAKYTLFFAIRFLGIALLGFILFGGTLFLMLNRRLGVNYFEDIVTLSRLQEKLPFILLTTGIIQTIALSFVMLIFALLWAHAIAGPLVRFRRFLNMVSHGQWMEDIAFRRNDQLQGLAHSMAHLQKCCQKREKKFISYLDQAQQLVKEYEDMIEQRNSASWQIQDKLNALKKVYADMQALLEREGAG